MVGYKVFIKEREIVTKEIADIDNPYLEVQAFGAEGFTQVIFNRDIMIGLLGRMILHEDMEFTGLSYLSGLEIDKGELVELMYEVITNYDRLYEGEDEISRMVFSTELGEVEFRINGSVIFSGDVDKSRILYETRRVVNSYLK